MAIDFLAMLNEQKKAQEEAEKASQKQKQSKGTIEPKKAEKPKKQKESPKKETKKTLSFEEQFGKADPQSKAIVRYLLFKFPDIEEKMKRPEVSIDGMNRYIQSQVRKNSKGGMFITVPQELIDAFPEEAEKEGYLSDSIVYGWGRHYYDEHGNVA